MVYLHDRFVAPEEAAISVFDRGFLLGDGVFATMRAYEGTCFRARQHLTILARGADALAIPLPMSIDRLASLAHECAVRARTADAYVRVTLTRGGGPLEGDDRPSLCVVAREMDPPSEEAYSRGVRVATVKKRRISVEGLDPSIKTTSYAPQVLSRREAESCGAFEGLELAADGSLACATMANLFAVVADALVTPPRETGCRLGITRQAILELAPRVGLIPREERIDVAMLRRAAEGFLTNTRFECLPIAAADGVAIGGGEFPRTAALRVALRELARAERRAR